MAETELAETIGEFNSLIIKALVQRYGGKLNQFPRYLENRQRGFIDIQQFHERYLSQGEYPSERLAPLVYKAMDINLQVYYLSEVDLGIYNSCTVDRGYDSRNPLNTPHLFLTRLSLDQSLIGKSQVLWERIVNFVYYLENGVDIESKVSGNKTKSKVFSEFLDVTPKWKYLLPYRDLIRSYDQSYRTPEFHKNSILRAEIFGNQTIDPDRLIEILNDCQNGFIPNLIPIAFDGRPRSYTNVHIDERGKVKKECEYNTVR